MFKVVDPEASVYVELTINGLACAQEFPPAEERAFVVGSTAQADLRVNGIGVAPVQFHIERDDGGIWLIPGYGIADLSVDSIRTLGPTALKASTVVEFCDVRIRVVVTEADRLATDDDRLAMRKAAGRVSRESYSWSLPGEEEPTVVAMRPVLASDRTDDPFAASIPEVPRERVDRVPAQPRAVVLAPPHPPSHDPRSWMSDDARPGHGAPLETAAQGASPRPSAMQRVPPSERSFSMKARPLLVMGGAGVGALVLAFTLVMVARLFASHRSAAAQVPPVEVRQTATVLDAKRSQ